MALSRQTQLIGGVVAAVVGAGVLLAVGPLLGSPAEGWIVAGLILGVIGLLGSARLFSLARLPVLPTVAIVCAELGVGLFWLGPWGWIYLVVAAVLLVVFVIRDRRRKSWEATGTAVTGTVVDSRRTGSVINNHSVVTKVTVRVEPPGGAEFTTTIRAVVPMGFDYGPGDRLPMLVNPARPGAAVIDHRPRTSAHHHDHQDDMARDRERGPSDEFLDTLARCVSVSEDRLLGLTRVEHADRMTQSEFAAALIKVPGWDDQFVQQLYQYCHHTPTLALTIWNLGGALRDGVIKRKDFDLSIRVSVK